MQKWFLENLKKNIFIYFREEGGRERNFSDERESLIGCLLNRPLLVIEPATRHVPIGN